MKPFELVGVSALRAVTPSLLLFVNSTLFASDISGDWEFAGKYLGDISYSRIVFKVDGEQLGGSLGDRSLEGTIHGTVFSFTTKRANGEIFGNFTGSVQGEKLEGTEVLPEDRKISWTAKRVTPAPAAPRVLDFEPTEFHRVFSDAIPPVLHIFPSDTVRTWTVD